MNILFIGSVIESSSLPKYKAASVAGNKMQLGIIKGLFAKENNISVISSLPFKMFNGKGKLFVCGKKSVINNSIQVKYIHYINVLFLKQLTLFINNFSSIITHSIRNRNINVLLVYNTVSFIAIPAILAAKIFGYKTVCIIADLPITDDNIKILHIIEDRIEISLIKKFDAIIPITKQIQLDYAPNVPYLVVEGGFDLEKKEISNHPILNEEKKKKIVFTGTLNSLSGIELLLEAFSKITSPDIQLHIYGSGEKESVVKLYKSKNEKVFFYGHTDNKLILEIQKSANLLVSPRLPDNYITKYTFPSKILEYITSGCPVLCNRLSGIPDEYNEYINMVDKCDSDEWAEMINRIINDSTGIYLQKAKNAKKFIESNKSWNCQSERINDFLLKTIVTAPK